jgi:hypothetical protein
MAKKSTTTTDNTTTTEGTNPVIALIQKGQGHEGIAFLMLNHKLTAGQKTEVLAHLVEMGAEPKAKKVAALLDIEMPAKEKGVRGRKAAPTDVGAEVSVNLIMEGAEKNKPAVRFRVNSSAVGKRVKVRFVDGGFVGSYVD